jgi:hypothetical protein
MQSFLLVIFQSFNFPCNTLLNNWLKNWGDFVSPLKKSVMQMLKRHKKTPQASQNIVQEQNMKHKFYDIIFMF